MSDRGDPHAATVLGAPSAEPVSLGPSRLVVAGRYEVLGLIGGGAMGTVYRARDRELDELIALKVLKKELASAPGMLSRFRREVKLARRVTHRNVARTFDIGEDGGDRFLTMELVDGESLATRLARAGRLSLREVIAVTKDLCAGLAAAHDAGVLHRDLKPDNVIVASDGRAVITDFGIARAVMESDARTAAGSFIGTPLYMAPEQVEGLAELDARADLYALGTMIFELLTGRPAWLRETLVAIAAARLLTPPPDARELVPDLPEPAALLVARLMARRREDRPSTAQEVAAAFDALAAPSTARISVAEPARPRTKIRLAVLPLEARGGEEDSYLAHGLTDELTALLGTTDGLAVRPRVAPTMLAGAFVAGPREIGRALDVDVVVEGSVERASGSVRGRLRLVTVEDGFQIWAQRIERPTGEVLRIAEDAARAIADALTAKLVVPVRPSAANPDAEDLLLKGRYHLYRWFGPNREAAIDMLRRAHALAPEDARIAGVLAIALARLYRGEFARSTVGEEARSVAFRALELDATVPEARVALGTVHLAEGDGEKAAIELAGALRVARSSVDALDAMGRLLIEAGDVDEGARLVESVLASENIAIARHALARMHALMNEWEHVDQLMDGLSHDAGALPTALLYLRFVFWAEDPARQRALLHRLAKVPVPRERQMPIAEIGEVIAGTRPPAALGRLFADIVGMLPSHARRGAAFKEQLRAEAALITGRPAEALSAIEAADASKLFDVFWLDRCILLEPLRADARFAKVRESVAARAQAIVAAYARARVGLRGRARRAPWRGVTSRAAP